MNSLKLPSICKSALQAVRSRTQLTLHATRRTSHDASRLVYAMSAWTLKTRRAPSRRCMGARVCTILSKYSHAITAIYPGVVRRRGEVLWEEVFSLYILKCV